MHTGWCPDLGSWRAGYDGRRFPVVIGELGSAFETTSDKQWLQDFADFVNAEVSLQGEGQPLPEEAALIPGCARPFEGWGWVL